MWNKKIIYLIIGVLLLFLVLGGVLVVIEDKPKDAWIDVLMIIVFSTFVNTMFFKISYRLHKMHSITKTKNNASDNTISTNNKHSNASNYKKKQQNHENFDSKPTIYKCYQI
ncbi:hypothetical protein [Staphylococcus ureilyticus]|uniref:hypothetical protein n=1 Tax=Staphylococcus ureilyticus TaxID=94138 RepID=UPI0034DCDE03